MRGVYGIGAGRMDPSAPRGRALSGRLSSSCLCTECCRRVVLPTACIAFYQPIIHCNDAATTTNNNNVVVAITAQPVWRFGGFVRAVPQLILATRALGYQHPKVPWYRAGCGCLLSKCRDYAFVCVLCKCKQLVPSMNLGNKSNPPCQYRHFHALDCRC